MTALEHLRRLWRHAAWADLELLRALERAPEAGEPLCHEYAHVVAAESVWLARLEGKRDPGPVWPALSLAEAAALGREVAAGYARFLDGLTEERVGATVRYVNSAGQAFAGEIGDILLHVALHGQYHRGKLNLLLRQGGAEPAPTDYIAFARGVPAATSTAQTRDIKRT